MILSSVFLFLIASSVTGQTSDYCSFTSKHTMCQYKGPGPACNGAPLSRGVTEKEKKIILDIHNKLRSRIAAGGERRGQPGPQPGASNMKIMVWDEELSLIAQRHADQCKFAHDCSTCRKTSRFGVGQNLYIYKQTLKPADNNWVAAVTDWYDEVELFDKKDVEPFVFSTPTGHFTQVVWAKTDKVGCGVTTYKDGQWYATLYTCNYGPNGNFIRGQMYKQGGACQDCEDSEYCSTEYPGLCVSGDVNSLRNVSRPDSSSSSKKTTTLSTTKKPRPTTTTTTTTAAKPRTTTLREAPVFRRTTTIPTTTRRRPVPTTRRPATTTTASRRVRPKSFEISGNNLEVNKNTDEDKNDILFTCEFSNNERLCNTKDRGKTWRTVAEGGNQFSEVELKKNEKAEFFFKKLISPPASHLACLDFRFKKHASDKSENLLTVLAWPFRGKPGKVTIKQESPDKNTWVRAQVTFKNVDRDFLLMFRARGPRSRRASLLLAIDSVTVTAGRCRDENN